MLLRVDAHRGFFLITLKNSVAIGRKTKLTEQVQEKICTHIRLGLAYERAAVCAGIAERTFWAWKARGEKAQKGIYHDFVQALKIADADAELLHIQNLTELAIGGRKYREFRHKRNADGSSERTITTKVLLPDAESAKWILGRRFKARWGNNGDGKSENDSGYTPKTGDDGLDELLSYADGYAEETGLCEENEPDKDTDQVL